MRRPPPATGLDDPLAVEVGALENPALFSGMKIDDVQRTAFLDQLQPGDFVNWVTFDGSSVWEVHTVTDDEIVLCRRDGSPGARFPRDGIIHHDAYGGYDDYLCQPGPTQLEYFLRGRYRHALEAATKDMDAAELARVARFAAVGAPASIQYPQTVERSLAAGELRKIADLLDAGEEAFRALERLTGRSASLSGGSQVQDTLRAIADQMDKDGAR
jgi:hypothetical protein